MARRDLSIRPSKKYLQPFIDEFIKQNGAKKWTDINKIAKALKKFSKMDDFGQGTLVRKK